MPPDPFAPLSFAHGRGMQNRLMLAPMTNRQSFSDGRLSEVEMRWLSMRATGGFGMTMTAAAHIQEVGKGFEGQLGVFSCAHTEGLAALAGRLRKAGSTSSVQLHHSGMRAPTDLIDEQPVSASDNEGARALTEHEVQILIEDFVAAAVRCKKAGFDGVEVHGAHGYIITQFLSSETNRRHDRYGGSFENRTRLLCEVLAGIRQRCGANLTLGVRLSPEGYGIELGEARRLAEQLMLADLVDYVDMSLWDYAKRPDNPEYSDRRLIDWFVDLPRGAARMGIAGKVRSGADIEASLDAGADFVAIGRSAILHHDFPKRFADNPAFSHILTPVDLAYLETEGVSPEFAAYLGKFGLIA